MGWGRWGGEDGVGKMGWGRRGGEDGVGKTGWGRRGGEDGVGKMGWGRWGGEDGEGSNYRIGSRLAIEVNMGIPPGYNCCVSHVSSMYQMLGVSLAALYHCHLWWAMCSITEVRGEGHYLVPLVAWYAWLAMTAVTTSLMIFYSQSGNELTL